ncbi:13046_t:CDS:2 [Racocetra fulgida]|uniref:13046_t:CDS:1 n=1 Tax=Racocetra fulgida TaxID=60492 RepID=A0A9N8YXN9_9GLOM|nr:13046_t:CDS:2 [Racocetra fulgida]
MSNIDLYDIGSYDPKSSDHDSTNASTSQTSNIVYNECSQEYSIKTSTGVLAKHLNKKHNRNITLKPRRFLVQKPYSKDDNTCIEECKSSILDFFVGDQIPFNTAESRWFRKMTSTLDLRY